MGIVYNTSVVRTGMQLWLDAANTKSYPGSGTTWTDLSGNSNTCTLVSGASYLSANNGSIFFDGADDRIAGPNSANLMVTTNFTLDVWVKRTATQGTEQVLMAKNGEVSPWVGYELMFGSDNNVHLWTSGGAGNGWNSFIYPITDQNWNNITVTFSGTAGSTGTALLYVNGTQQATMSNKITPGSPSLRIFEMGCIRASGRFLSGSISSARVYNITLTANQVLQNFNALRGRYGV
jgi:hypothetical protein